MKVSRHGWNLLDQIRDLEGEDLLFHPQGLGEWQALRALIRKGFVEYVSHGSCRSCNADREYPLFRLTEAGRDFIDREDEKEV